jgi:isochorismate pyruvate lyase
MTDAAAMIYPGAMIDADACTTMAEVRAGVDSLDAALVALLGQRMALMRAAARIKPHRSDVRDEARKAQVIDNVMRLATGAQVPGALVEDLWDMLVEASIAYELAHFDARRVTAE